MKMALMPSLQTRNSCGQQRGSAKSCGVADEAAIKSLNKKLDNLFIKDKFGNWQAPVCALCDQFVGPAESRTIPVATLWKNSNVLKPAPEYCLPLDIINYYKVNGTYAISVTKKGKVTVCDESEKQGKKSGLAVGTTSLFDLSSIMLSPRSQPKQMARTKEPGFLCCKYCYTSLAHGKIPTYGISNGFFPGPPPPELMELNDVELAFLSPVKARGYFFAFTGDGYQKALRGSMSFFKVNPLSIANAVQQWDACQMRDALVVVLYGKMTPFQKDKAKNRTRIRPEKVMDALKWLVKNNKTWQEMNLDLDRIRSEIRSPVLIDESTTVHQEASQNVCDSGTNVEQTDSFKIWFPDQSINQLNGGCESIEEFNEQVKKLKLSGYTFQCEADFLSQAVGDDKGDNLVNACLQQFPYARGGLNEMRRDKDNGFSGSIDIVAVIRSFSRISQTHFHYELFALILYNMYQKQEMIRKAFLKLRNKHSVDYVATELSLYDIGQVLDYRQRHLNTTTFPGNEFIGAVDAMAGSVGITNEATNKARRDAEAMQHHFGLATYFLTVNPDDNNCFAIQVYSRNIVDDGDCPATEMTDEDIAKRYQKRLSLRLKCPGICAYVFELLMDIIKKEIIGWGKNKTNTGIFGECQAWTQTVEEQCRRSLHSHFQIWIKDINEVREKLDTGVTCAAQATLAGKIDEVISTKMFFHPSDIENSPSMTSAMKNIFPHECCKNGGECKSKDLPEVVNEQGLRHLRHRLGKSLDMVYFATCMECGKRWMIDEFVQDYLVHGLQVPMMTKFPETPHQRLKTMAVDYQRGLVEKLPYYVVESAYNVHNHVPNTCFKKRKGSNERDEECRMRYPKAKRRRTCFEQVSEEKIPWYRFDGTHFLKTCYEILVKRSEFDSFQNQSCPIIGHSKLTCNTNLQMMVPGLVASYIVKYVMKDTQGDDKREYRAVLRKVEEILSRPDRRHDSNFSEAVSRLMCAALAHQSSNVLGATMASYLTRNGTRFCFSHEFVWCPLRDLCNIIEHETINFTIESGRKAAYVFCPAFDYICRPACLEHLNVFDFYTWYESRNTKKSKKHSKDALEFQNTAEFVHPSFDGKTKTFRKHLVRRNSPLLVKVIQYDFPDTATFQGSLLDTSIPNNLVMEQYSKLALTLFHPFRTRDDLVENGSFTERLRHLLTTTGPERIEESCRQFLQNIQDAKANSFRYLQNEDDLQRKTNKLKVDKKLKRHEEEDADEDDEEDENQALEEASQKRHELLLSQLTDEAATSTPRSAPQNMLRDPTSLNLIPFRLKGTDAAGWQHLPVEARPNLTSDEVGASASIVAGDSSILNGVSPDSGIPVSKRHQRAPTKSELVTTLRLVRSERRTRDVINDPFDADNDSSPVKEFPIANGTAASIRQYARVDGLDELQSTAFEIIAASFVLTFFKDATRHQTVEGPPSDRHIFDRERQKLEVLARQCQHGGRDGNLIALMHGPGGAGKSRVINLVVRYAKEYCRNLPDVEFTKQTILVCGYSGVAATLLLGETMHSALKVNNKTLTYEMIEDFQNTRLVIIDEISFASERDFKIIDSNMRALRNRSKHQKFGGVDIVFAGNFRQIEPVGETPIYKSKTLVMRDFINCYLAVEGKHRFADDPEWGEILERFRNGTVTREDIQKINERVVSKGLPLPPKTTIACHLNRNRDAKNAAVFHEHLKHRMTTVGNTNDSILIFGSSLKVKVGDRKYVPCVCPEKVYQFVAEDDIDYRTKIDGRVDPVLKLTIGAPVMVTKNLSVPDGKANGTKATVEKVVLKHNARTFNVSTGPDRTTFVTGVYAEDVQFIYLRHENPDIQPAVFPIEHGKPHTIHAKVPMDTSTIIRTMQRETMVMQMTQFPIVSNAATTVHKLQGSTLHNLFIHEWHYKSNWVYVALSRVRTRQGLFLQKELSTNLDKYKVDKDYVKMIQTFRRYHTPDRLTAEEEAFLVS